MSHDIGLITHRLEHNPANAFQLNSLSHSSSKNGSPSASNDAIGPVRSASHESTRVSLAQEPDNHAHETVAETTELGLSKVRAITVIATLAGINFLNTMGSGILIAALPRIARDVGLDQSLILWPAAVYALAAGCLLLIFGAVADVVGPKVMWLTGSFLFVAFTVALGQAQTAIQVIVFRTLLGLSISMCLPTAVSLITNTFPRGTWRNVAFAVNGAGNPTGYAVGLVLGGIFTDTIGWRWAYYMMAIICACISIASIWSLPKVSVATERSWKARLVHDIDWTGALIISVSLGMLLYVLAMTSSSYKRLDNPENIVLLTLSILGLTAFPFWMNFQTKKGRPALIPNKVWRNWAFTAVCVSVFLCWASLSGIEYYMTLYFQEVQGLTALRSSLQFIPHAVMGAAVNVLTGYLISRVNVRTLAVVSALITMAAAPLMATITVGQNYWYAPFWAMILSPVNPDVLFTVSNLVISQEFPQELQSLAGGVFNEVSQFGNSVGLAITAAIAASVTEHSGLENHKEALMKGYRAAFWTIFASCTTVLVVVWVGLKKGGIVGKKDE